MTRQSVRRTANVLVGALAAMSVVSILGCVSAHRGPFDANGLPREKYFVGGGMMINWTAPQDGTAYVVMSAGGESKIVQTEGLKEAKTFEFYISGVDNQGTPEVLGVKLSEAKFSLYFVPSPTEKSAQ